MQYNRAQLKLSVKAAMRNTRTKPMLITLLFYLARGFVLGTTLLFGKGRPYGETLQDIRELKF